MYILFYICFVYFIGILIKVYRDDKSIICWYMYDFYPLSSTQKYWMYRCPVFIFPLLWVCLHLAVDSTNVSWNLSAGPSLILRPSFINFNLYQYSYRRKKIFLLKIVRTFTWQIKKNANEKDSKNKRIDTIQTCTQKKRDFQLTRKK